MVCIGIYIRLVINKRALHAYSAAAIWSFAVIVYIAI